MTGDDQRKSRLKSEKIRGMYSLELRSNTECI